MNDLIQLLGQPLICPADELDPQNWFSTCVEQIEIRSPKHVSDPLRLLLARQGIANGRRQYFEAIQPGSDIGNFDAMYYMNSCHYPRVLCVTWKSEGTSITYSSLFMFNRRQIRALFF